jgi:hypothetical protein
MIEQFSFTSILLHTSFAQSKFGQLGNLFGGFGVGALWQAEKLSLEQFLSSRRAVLFRFLIFSCPQCSLLLSGWPGLNMLLDTLFPEGHQLRADSEFRTADVQYRELYFHLIPYF